MATQDPGVLRWLISCDESGVDGAPFYGFGSLWMRWQRRGDFARDFKNLRNKHRYFHECKWNKANNQLAQPFFEDLVDYFFTQNWLTYHCIVFRKGMVKREFHKNYDEQLSKHFTMLLTNKVKGVLKLYPNRDHTFRVWVDPFPSRYKKTDEAVEVISNNVIAKAVGELRPVDTVIVRDSKSTPTIQLCDLLLGAVMEAWQKNASSSQKKRLQDHIASYLGWSDLEADTFPEEQKFNIWYFHDNRGPREAKTREVDLKYPFNSSVSVGF